ncbi:hypothetical protein HNY73_007297 [Argiope bruennichi]|uniref:Uncharacterized protein n=1 Tax=Argiope bruennichi TaxID=94029 RepID=A0A8T0FE16_ARGBR|nr:hypothetical protein HNY73_007297 [Argiope bruennichi]
MSETRYYFPNVIEDNSLAILAVTAKDVLRNNDTIISIFQTNNELLYGQSPRRVLVLMRQNNKSIFSSSPISESSSSVTIPSQEPSTPVTRNPDAADLPRTCLPFDDTEKKVSNMGSLEPITPVRHQSVIVSCKKKDAPIDETAEVGEHFASPVGSTDSPGPSRQESPTSVKMTENLSMDEKVLESPTKIGGSPDTGNKESLRSPEITAITPSLTVSEQDTNPIMVEDEGDLNVSAKEFPRPVEIIKMTPNLEVDEKEPESLVKDQSFTDLATDTIDPGEKTEASISPDSINKDSVNPTEETVKIPEPDEVGTPSPVKRSKIGNISDTDIQEFTSPAEIVSSPECSEIAVSPLKDDKTIISPKEVTAVIASDTRKRKSPSPKQINTTLFRSIPRIIQASGESEIDILVSCDTEETTNPTTSGNPSTDPKSDKKEMNLAEDDNEVAGSDDSVIETLPKSIESYLSSPENPISVSSSGNSSEIKRPGSHDNALFVGQCSSDTPSTSTTSTKELLSKSESSLKEAEPDPTWLDYTVRKFETLLLLRNQIMQKIFNALLIFQNNLRFLKSYVNNISFVVQQIGLPENAYACKELKEIVNDALATASKLTKKLVPWSVDVDLEVNTWYNCFQQIQRLKSKYGPVLSTEGKPRVSIEDLKVYEREMKAIWKQMDDMIMMGDCRRSLFLNTAHDFEMLIKLFVNCLIFVGILQPR